MIEPSKSKQKEVKEQELYRISAMNIFAYQTIKEVQKYVKMRVPKISKLSDAPLNIELNKLSIFIEDKYQGMFERIKSGVNNARVKSGIEQRYIAEQTLGETIKWAVIPKEIPKTKDYQITNKILSDKSILRRNKVLASRVSLVIKKEVDKGSSVQDITKKVEIELGFRDKNGKTSRKQLADIKKGKFAHTNGHFYQAYRIARTESMRMASLQTHDVFEQLKTKGRDVRMQLISKIDSRTRQQSISMNGQVSDKNGRFRYPNGRMYILGEAPAMWSINDRETQVIIFNQGTKKKPIYKSLKQFESRIQNGLTT